MSYLSFSKYPSIEGFVFQRLTVSDLEDVLQLQGDVFSQLGDASWLRANSAEMLRECLVSEFALGAWKDGRLVAAGILVESTGAGNHMQPKLTPTMNLWNPALQGLLTEDSETIKVSCNLKLILVDPDLRRFGLAKTIVKHLGQEAVQRGYRYILCTIHPENVLSQRLFRGLGYERRATVETSYGVRDVFELDTQA